MPLDSHAVSGVPATFSKFMTAIAFGPGAVDTAARKSGNSKTYTAKFTFRTAGGVEVTRVKSFPETLLADVQAGRPIKVLYDPRDPAKFVFESEEPSWSLPGAGIAIAIVALIFA